jgi:hypothetical protein
MCILFVKRGHFGPHVIRVCIRITHASTGTGSHVYDVGFRKLLKIRGLETGLTNQPRSVNIILGGKGGSRGSQGLGSSFKRRLKPSWVAFPCLYLLHILWKSLCGRGIYSVLEYVPYFYVCKSLSHLYIYTIAGNWEKSRKSPLSAILSPSRRELAQLYAKTRTSTQKLVNSRVTPTLLNF